MSEGMRPHVLWTVAGAAVALAGVWLALSPPAGIRNRREFDEGCGKLDCMDPQRNLRNLRKFKLTHYPFVACIDTLSA